MIHKNNIIHLYLERRNFILSLIFLTSFSNNSFGFISIEDSLVTNDSTEKTFINDNIFYDASDSMRFDILNQKVLLYGEAFIKYEKTEIKADFIEIDWENNQIYARGRIDSTGRTIGGPQFTESGKAFKAKEIIYNYKSKKGSIKELVTQEGEGFIHGRKVKKSECEKTKKSREMRM